MQFHRTDFRRFRWVAILALAASSVALIGATSIASLARTRPGLPAIAGTLANPQAADEDGVTPLMRAARDGEARLLRSLLKEGGDVNSADAYGWTALTYAARRGDASMVAALANKGADLNHQSDDGLTPLMYAVSEGYADAVRVLLERGANVNATSKSGATALTLAEQRNNAQQTMAGTKTVTPSRTVERKDYAEVVEQLKRAGAFAGSPGPLLQLAPAVDSRPVALNHPYPAYTEEARRYKINATIHMRVLVGEDGAVKKVRVLVGAPYGLTEQAVISAHQLRFKPASRGGRPVESWTSLSMDFNIR
ncbi:MAG TPA: ankyrin repeat domain-containing protein [Blastocatellia bacterium]|nr:ankyrin repeat domain-containing protein [Blastocatellia bacterium]